MSEEIKEILDVLKSSIGIFDIILEPQQCVMLLDYITNLQQDYEKLKDLVNPKPQIFIDTEDMEERYGRELYEDYLKEQVKNYKSRCKKANEYVNKMWLAKLTPDIVSKTKGDLLNILKGENND